MIVHRSVLAVVIAAILTLMPTHQCVAQMPTKAPTDSVFRLSILGQPTRLVLSCTDVIQSMAWWSRIGFTPTPGNTSRPDSAITMSDGQLVITLVKDFLPSPILMFASRNIRMLKDSLDSLRVPVLYDVHGPTLGELRLKSPSNVHIAVRPSDSEKRVPVSGDSNIACGKFTEVSVSVADFPIKKEKMYWEMLDFSIRKSGDTPYKYAIITDGYVNVGLHELRDIPSVAITYFAPDMKARLDRLKKAGITFSDEYKDADGVVEHAYLLSPDGQLVMLFNGTP